MRSIRNLALAGALALAPALSQAAFAQEGAAYPRIVPTGDTNSVEYGPGPRGNIVGGGAISVRYHYSDNNAEVDYLEPQYAQRRTDRLVPVVVTSGESTSVSYVVPAEPATKSLAALLRFVGG